MDLTGLAALVVAIGGLVAACASAFKDRGKQQRLKTNVELLKELPEGTDARASMILLIEEQVDGLLTAEAQRWGVEVRRLSQAYLFGALAVYWFTHLTDVPRELTPSLNVFAALGLLAGLAYSLLALTGPGPWRRLFRMDRDRP